MKGQKALFEDLIEETIQYEHVPESRGRNQSLLSKRDDCLLNRFYYYQFLRHLNYPYTISRLVEEFFITEYQLATRLGELKQELKALKAEAPTERDLMKKFPWLVW